MTLRRHRRSRVDDAIVSTIAFAWIGRGAWRVYRGRFPWSGTPSRRR